MVAYSGGLLVLVDVGQEPLGGRLRRSLGERHRLLHRLVDRLLDDPEVALPEHPLAETAVAEERDRIPQLLALYLVPGAIDGPGRVAHGVAAEAIGAHLDEGGRLFPARPLDDPPDALAHGEDFHAVDGLAEHSVRLGEPPD